MKTWKEPEALYAPEDLLDMVGGSRIAASALYRRGITTPDAALAFLDPLYTAPCPPTELPGMDAAVRRIRQAIERGEPICVWGDFDVDGQTSTTILVEALQALGTKVQYHIPNRAKESHGVHLRTIKPLIDQGIRLFITCDTGISAMDMVGYAKSRGVDFVITDHHELPDNLPDAAAVVDPHLLPEDHPLATLPGAGVAYQLAAELCRQMDREQESARFLDLAALGIVADMALLRGETRRILQLGLAAFRRTQRPGLLELMQLADINPCEVTEEHIGFLIAPRLNALGRLEDANSAVEFFTTTSPERAHLLAANLDILNGRRKLLTNQVYEGALAQIDRHPELLDDQVLVLFHPEWPGGVVGIVASRLVERFSRPVILMSAPEGELARGSARSVDGVDITRAIATQAHLLEGFGGHPMAAGMSLQSDRIPEFRRGLSRAVGESAEDLAQMQFLEIDAEIPLSELSLQMVENLERLAPFGPGNPALTLYARGLTLLNTTPVGRSGDHLQLVVSDADGCTQKAIWWQGSEETNQSLLEVMRSRFDLAYRARSSNYRGQPEIQVEFVDARPSAGAVLATPVKKREILDLRNVSLPLAALKSILTQEQAQIWREADAAKKLSLAGIDGSDRYNLQRSPCLVIWTSPPGPRELQAALEAARPEKIILFAVQPECVVLESFLKRLAGMVKYALSHYQGEISVKALAAGTAQREPLIRIGVAWLEAQGFAAILQQTAEGYRFIPGTGESTGPAEPLERQVKAMLEETNAYREYFRTADQVL
jgi:single-stranded-DNA-specific exonuclease